MMFKKNIDCSHLNKDGIISMMLFWDAEVAVFCTEYRWRGEKQKTFNIANPTDWHWLTHGGADGNALEYEEAERVFEFIKNAKHLWEKVRVIARMLGLKWLDKPYMKVARMEYTDVFIRHTHAPFVPTQHCGARLLPAGEFILELGAASSAKFEHDEFKIATSERCAYIDLRYDRSDIKTFVERPHIFDGDAAKTTLGHKGTAFRVGEDGVALIDADHYEIEIEIDEYGYVKRPRLDMRVPYALLYKFREDVARVKYN